MKRIAFILVILIGVPILSQAQKVGLVLSGGAAKGIAHIGVLKALEQNDIPVDYVVGTSMGGIIAGCYAAGMSPDQIESIILSDHFLRWINGSPEEGFNYYFYKNDDTPGFLKLYLSLDSTWNIQWKSSLANDVSLNFALAEKMIQASAISGQNFDSLFVPLRVVAADIFTQNEVILSKGFLSDALRATQTVPFFYTPIRVDGKYLFDGGVYNNFPVNVVQEEFNPDVIIGSNVSSKIFEEYPYDRDEKLISNSLLFMLLDKSDPAQIPETGIYIQPDLRNFTSFDFSQAKSLIDSGYIQTMRQMDEIKAKISERRTCDEVMELRNRFHNQNVPLVFNDLILNGFNSKQRKYIQRIFRINPEKPKPLYFSDIKKGYFRLVSEEYFNNIYPNFIYKSGTETFDFQLARRPQRNFQVDFGGLIASRNISNIFLGVNYYYFNRALTHAYAGFQTGSFYRSAIVKARIDLPLKRQFYIEPEFAFNSWDFLEGQDLLIEQASPTILKRTDRGLSLNMGWPAGKFFKASLGAKVFNNVDRYSNNDVFVSTDTLDELRLKGVKLGLSLSANSLNRKQYASSGRAYSITANYFNLREYHTPGNTSVAASATEQDHQWFQVKASAEQYFHKGWYRPGYFAEAVFSNQSAFRNYIGTVANAPAFQPLQDSRTLLLQNFRAFNYVALGMRNVFTLRNRLDLRLAGYLFKPIEYLYPGGNQETNISSDLSSIYFTGTAGLVLHSPIGPISLSVNYYDDKENQLGVLLHVGFLLFNNHTLE